MLVSAFQLLPVWMDDPILNHSRWEQSWKWDSFGAGVVLKALFTGELLDHGRLPVLSLLALLGAASDLMEALQRPSPVARRRASC